MQKISPSEAPKCSPTGCCSADSLPTRFAVDFDNRHSGTDGDKKVREKLSFRFHWLESKVEKHVFYFSKL